MRLGIFGGSFDPVHVGHLIVAQEAGYRARLDRVFLVPSARPPHKPERVFAPIAERVAMVRLAIDGIPGLATLEREAGEETAYTVETLRWARRRFGPTAELYLVIGADSLVDLPSWREPDAILELATLLVYPRSGVDLSGVEMSHVMLEGDAIAVSSSTLRRRIREGAPTRFWLPDSVRDHVERGGLYRDRTPC